MKHLFLHIIRLFVVMLFVLLPACHVEEELVPAEVGTEKVRVQLFTRVGDYTVPQTRATDGVDKTTNLPIVLVFSGSGSDAVFVEAVQSESVGDILFVTLTTQSSACQLLILANPDQQKFYRDVDTAGEYTFSAENFNAWLGGTTPKTLAYAQMHLFSTPLSDPQTTAPFTGYLPMSTLYATTSITKGMKIQNSDDTSLLLTRNTAKVILKNEASNFTLYGITEVRNAPQYGYWYAQTQLPTWGTDELIHYSPTTGNIANVALTTDQTTAAIYLYESAKANETHLIVKGAYQGNDYYYKMAIVGNPTTENPTPAQIDLKRNHAYTFTITKVYGTGHRNLTDAINAPEFNNDLVDVTLTVTDLSAYETTAFDDYYLSVSNSIYMGFGNNTTDGYEICSIVLGTENASTTTPTNGAIILPAGLTIAEGDLTITANRTVKVKFADTFRYGEITLVYGNVRKTVSVWRNIGTPYTLPSHSHYITATGKNVLCLYSWVKPDDKNEIYNYFGYYLVSGEVAEASQAWIELSPDGGKPSTTASQQAVIGTPRNDKSKISVSDGMIQVHVQNGSGSGRTGVAYLSTGKNPGYTNPNDYTQYTRRIKVEFVQ